MSTDLIHFVASCCVFGWT